jgi:protein involved in polysaccharide export with SLBB domain
VSVTLSESHSRHFFVFGEVRRPGKYPLIGNVTTLHALAAAGGATRFASLSSSRLVRPTPEQRLVYAVNLDEISRYGNGDTNYKLQPGDVVYIPPNAWARVGHALGVVFYPLQQILGLGRSTTVIMSGGGGGF